MIKITDEMLNDYIDNQLDTSSINELKKALSENPELLKKLQALKTVDETLKDIEVFQTPNNFTERVMEKLLKQVKKVKPGINYFFSGIVAVFIAIIASVLIAAWLYIDKQNPINSDNKLYDTTERFLRENIDTLSGFFSSNQLVFAGGFLTIVLCLTIILMLDSHRNFKNKLKSIN